MVLLSFILLRYYSTARAGSGGKNLKRTKKDSPHLSWNDHFFIVYLTEFKVQYSCTIYIALILVAIRITPLYYELKRAAPEDSPCYVVIIFLAFPFGLRRVLRTSIVPSDDEQSAQECRRRQKAIQVDISHPQKPARKQAPYPPV